MARRDRTLSPREREVVALIAAGLTVQQVAERLGISAGTARNHAQVARQKLGVAHGVRFARWLAENGGAWARDDRPGPRSGPA